MKSPRDRRKDSKRKAQVLPPGGGAAARAYQFALERGLAPKEPEEVITPQPPRKTAPTKPRRSK